MATKYIVVKYIERTKEGERTVLVPVTFPRVLVHADMADYVKMILRHDNRNIMSTECISAGFVEMDKEGIHYTHGRSESLSLASRKEDAEIIANWEELHKDVPY